MAERHPGWVNNIDAFEARLATGLMVTAEGVGDALDPLRVRTGIRDSPGNPGLVTLGTNKVTVNPFQAVVADPAKPAQGAYLVTSDAVKELVLGAASASLYRMDLVVAEIIDAEPGFQISVYPGENSSSTTPPRPPVTNPLSLVLAEITIPPAGTTATLSDKRRFTAALNAILPVRNADDRPKNPHGSLIVYRLDTKVIEVWQNGAWAPYRPPRGDTWHAATLQNSWVNYGAGYNDAAYTRTDDGWVHLRGLVKSGTLDQAIFTLPVGYRPVRRELLGVSTNNDVHGRVDVLTDGRILATTGSNGWMSLDGLTFATY